MATIASPQELEFPISPTPVGSGARAAGMADAFLSIADDATAASWNPAGLVQLERPEISIVGATNLIFERFFSNSNPELKSKQDDSNLDINFLSFVYPVPFTVLERNAALALTYQQKFDLSRRFNANLNSEPFGVQTRDNFVFKQDGSLNVIAPAVAIELTKRLSIGMTVNIWRDSLAEGKSFEQTLTRSTFFEGAPIPTFAGTTHEEYEDFSGESVSVGLLWNVAEVWNLGFRFDSGFMADANYTVLRSGTLIPNPVPFEQKRQLKIPATHSFGVSRRFGDRMTAALDMSVTDWDKFYVQYDDEGARRRISLIDGSDLDDPSVATNFDTTVTARLGMEYVFIPDKSRLSEEAPSLWTIRGGLFFDQEPASGRSADAPNAPGDGKPDDFFGFAVGLGVLFSGRFNIDAAYQLRHGNNVNGDFVRGPPGFDFSEDVVQHRILLSAVIYF